LATAGATDLIATGDVTAMATPQAAVGMATAKQGLASDEVKLTLTGT
jgi:hypothetical protein